MYLSCSICYAGLLLAPTEVCSISQLEAHQEVATVVVGWNSCKMEKTGKQQDQEHYGRQHSAVTYVHVLFFPSSPYFNQCLVEPGWMEYSFYSSSLKTLKCINKLIGLNTCFFLTAVISFFYINFFSLHWTNTKNSLLRKHRRDSSVCSRPFPNATSPIGNIFLICKIAITLEYPKAVQNILLYDWLLLFETILASGCYFLKPF